MCKFHKDLARAIAVDPRTGEFDPGKYAVALVGMFPRLEEYIPEMFGCDGFVPAQMAGDDVQEYLNQSPQLRQYVYNDDSSLRSLADIRNAEEQFREDHLGLLRTAMAQVAGRHDLTEAGLAFPDFNKHTLAGYKPSCCADPDPRQNGAFLDVAVVYAYEGYRAQKVSMGNFGAEWDGLPEFYAERPLTIREDVPDPDLQEIKGYKLGPIMAAVRDYHAIDGVRDVIEQMFAHAVTRIFRGAPDDLKNGIGFDASFGCVMCGSAGQNFQAAACGTDQKVNEPARTLEV